MAIAGSPLAEFLGRLGVVYFRSVWARNLLRAFLTEYRQWMTTYDDKKRQELEDSLGLTSDSVQRARNRVGLGILQYTRPPAVGGYIQNVEVALNATNPSFVEQDLPPQFSRILVVAIGAYESRIPKELAVLLAPPVWVWKLFVWVASIPVSLLVVAGFERDRIRRNWLVRGCVLLIELIMIAAAAATVLNYLGVGIADIRLWLGI